MCGIAGIITTRRDRANDGRPDTPLSRMVGAMVHRGPDDAGCAWHEVGAMQVGLGHRRLSIIDLSSEGHQPMVDPITGATMIFNGELYNYRDLRAELEAGGVTFRGQCDAEVLLHALGRWGAETLERCCGMYALAYLDPTRRRLLLARDHLGIKPLYVAEQGDTLLFASEVRSLLASGLVPRRVDRRAVATYLAYGAVQEPDTIVAGVRSFPPGHAAWIDLDQPVPRIGRPVPHWTMPVPRPMSEAEAIEAYRATFDTAVREHLASDVPLAVLLSAGLDSTVIAAAAARHAADLRTFTIGFDDHADLDESELAAETARLLGTRHTTVPISSDDCRTLVPAWLEDLDQPSVDGLNVYLIAKTIAEHDITVILSGLGADETFGGYPSFTDVPRLARAMRQLRFLPRPVRAGLARTLAAGRPAAVRAKLVDLLTSDGDVVTLCLHRRRTMSNRQMATLGQDAATLDLHPLFVPPRLMDRVERGSDDLAWMIAQIETRFYQGNMLLRD
ncbi:MAG: asparagine synthase (glutamine-hydrolyzing), partial [Phycisphaerales bacterium]|nr:asparagine synthase (glutamine-hydrolyzing) [Phycisphaerales bacterium]